MEGVIVKGVGGFYTARAEDGSTYTLRAQGKLRRARVTPMVGDRISLIPGAAEANGWLTEVLPRKNSLTRPPIANIDLLCVVVAAASPEPDMMLVDRVLIAARQSAIECLIIVNKTELARDTARRIERQFYPSGIPVRCVSTRTDEGIEALRLSLLKRTHAFTGQSGVGKSSLINALYALSLPTGDVSERIERGKHTTRHTELLSVPGGGYVFDTPGFSLLEMELMPPEAFPRLYPEFERYQDRCRFQPCLHGTEPGCAVRQALKAGNIDQDRYDRYCAHLTEIKERWKYRYD